MKVKNFFQSVEAIAQYELSFNEKLLYEKVTEYVREEMNRADRNAEQEGEGGGGAKRRVVGFALMTLQRRLASSPFAINRSIERRRVKLEARLREEKRYFKVVRSGSNYYKKIA